MTDALPKAKGSASLLAQHLALERNLALLAGAGVGKTYNLITICLHLLGGARREPISPSQLCLLTFTDKAAAELRARLRARLDALATGASGPEKETELARAFTAGGSPFPPCDLWRKVRDDLGAATIGTFHSLCVQLLRRAPGGLGVDPAFELLEERDAASLIHDTAERLVLELVEQGASEVTELCRELGFTGDGRVRGLVDHLCQVFTKVREEGVSPLDIPISSEAELREQLEQARIDLALDIDVASANLAPKLRARFEGPLQQCRAAVEGLTVENFLEPERFPALRQAVASDKHWTLQKSNPALQRVKWRVNGASDHDIVGIVERYVALMVLPHERAFLTLLGRLQESHREALARRGALDFSELLIRTRDLLSNFLPVRAEVQERFRALLVDEFQDTNWLQLELVTLLSERRAGAPRPLPHALGKGVGKPQDSAVLELPLEPGFLCVVGDRKQSIYEFRGADVSVFGLLAEKIEEEGGACAFLQTNRRSVPKLLELFNRTFAQLMRAPKGLRPYHVVYEPAHDDLEGFRPQRSEAPCVVRLYHPPERGLSADACRHLDADAVARYLRSLLDGGAPAVFDERGASRPARGGDVAVLFRRFTFLETYRQALIRQGVPHRVVRGRGFYGAPEVMDLASLLSLIADPTDALSFAAVLRSPLVALSDTSLFKLAQANHGRLWLRHVLEHDTPAPWSLPEDEAARLLRFRRLFPRLRAEKDRLGIRSLLQVALEDTGYRVAMAGTPFGEQALANLDKLLELARRWDAAGAGECSAFAREVLSLADRDPTEAQADVLDSADPRAVQLLTIHQAKGLEWPVVVVPDLAAKRRGVSDRVVLDRQRGLAIKPWLQNGDAGWTSPRFQEIVEELNERDRAEHQRLLYVALTRAKERLVLSGAGPANKDTWWKQLDEAITNDPQIRSLVRDVPLSELVLPGASPPSQVAESQEQRARVEKTVARVRQAPLPRPRAAVLPVTHLQDYFRCPRRYLYAHQVGLSEFPHVFDLDEDAGLGRSSGDSRHRGTLAHSLLERTPLALVGSPRLREALEELLWEEQVDPSSREGKDVLGWVEGFWRTHFGRKLADVGEARVHRELPFLLELGGGERLALFLKGQIDLLFEDDDGSAVVVDYKASLRPQGGLAAYTFQLDCYALAARRFVKEGVEVRTGIAFLREKDQEPQVRPSARLDLLALEAALVEGASSLLSRMPGQEWPGRELEACVHMGCGYRYRCHPNAKRL
ncbi:MAG: UvrD-helicase domain-containing protein [Myxococcota bacterium]